MDDRTDALNNYLGTYINLDGSEAVLPMLAVRSPQTGILPVQGFTEAEDVSAVFLLDLPDILREAEVIILLQIPLNVLDTGRIIQIKLALNRGKIGFYI